MLSAPTMPNTGHPQSRSASLKGSGEAMALVGDIVTARDVAGRRMIAVSDGPKITATPKADDLRNRAMKSHSPPSKAVPTHFVADDRPLPRIGHRCAKHVILENERQASL